MSQQGEARRARDAVSELAEMRALLGATLDGFILADSDGAILDVNPAYCQLTGYGREELLEMNIRQLEASLTSDEVRERIERMVRDGKARFETRHRRRDGTLVDLDVSICVIRSGEDHLVGAFVRSLTELRRISSELRSKSLLLEKAQQLAHLGIWRWSVAENRVTWSDELYRIYGQDPATFGASFEAYLALVHQGDRERVRRTVGEALQRCEDFQFGERIVRPDGEVRWLRSWGSVTTDEEGRPRELFGACLDVTDQRRTVDALRRSRDELEARVEERTAELAEAKERAESTDQLKSAFLAAMSHELRTPLNSILGFTGIILQGLVGELNDEQRKQLRMVQHSARHLLDLINDVLDISKIEAGQLALNEQLLDAGDVVDRSLEMVRPLAQKKGIALRLERRGVLPAVRADERRLQQVLINLLTNAIKFTPKGEVRLRVEERDRRLCFTVTDTGVGIPEGQLEQIFEPFSQVDSGLARRHEGTGLGLAISRRLVRMMRGDITVRSQLGEGSSFDVCLPCCAEGER